MTESAGPQVPIIAALTSPELIAAVVALLAALIARLASRLKRQQKDAAARLDNMSVHISRAADAAEAASEGVHNNHEQNLRDDLDMKFDDVFTRIDALTGAVESLRDTVSDQTRRLGSMESQLEGVRNDAREDRSFLHREVSDIHGRIGRMKARRGEEAS